MTKINVIYLPATWELKGRSFFCQHEDTRFEDLYDDIPSTIGGRVEYKIRTEICNDCGAQYLGDGWYDRI